MQHERGFTVIELLVVVAIITLLIAMILPSLGSARGRAKLTTCATNLHALTTGALVYSASWGQYLPPQRGQGVGGYTNTASTYQMNNSNDRYGFALIYNEGAITDYRVYYCPAQTDVKFTLDTNLVRMSSGGWESLNKSKNGGGRMGYNYQVHSTTDQDSPGFNDVAYPRTIDYPPMAVVACDQIAEPEAVAHGGPVPGAKFNLSFIDGHVSTVSSPAAVAEINRRRGGLWSSFAATINALEVAAAR